MQAEEAKKRYEGRGVEATDIFLKKNWNIHASEQCFNTISIKYDDGSSNGLS